MDELVKNGLVFELGGGLLVDTAGNNTVTNNGATLTADHNGRANRGWSFDGVNDVIVLPNTLIRNKSLLSFEFGHQRNQGTVSYILSAGDTTANRFSVFISDSGLNVVIGDGSVANNSVVTQITGNWNSDWNHYIFIYDGSQSGNANRIKFWMNGIFYSTTTLAGTIPAVISNVDNELSVGSRGTAYFAGKNDLLKISNRALTESEIKKLYNYWRSH